MAQTPDFNTGLFLADTSSAAGTVILPYASQLQGRTITIKDANQSFGQFPCYVETSVGDTFQDGTSTLTLEITNSYLTLVAYGSTWYTIGSYQNLFNSTIIASTVQVSSIATNIVNLSNAVQLTFSPVATDFSWVNGILYTGNQWVATGLTSGTPTGTIQTSSNGINWVPQCNALVEGYAVAYNGSNLYAAVGYTDGTSNSTIVTSSNGTTWTPRLTTLTRARTIAHNQYNRWMVGGYTTGVTTGTIQTSTDGTTWTNLPTNSFTDVHSIAYGANKWVATGYTNGTSNATLQTSTDDGQTWIARTTPFTTGYAVAYNGIDQWIAMGYTNGTSTGTLLTSGDTVTWTAQSTFFTSTFGSVAYGGGRWVAVGNANESKSASIQTSINGSNWTPISNLLSEGYSVAYNGSNQWVVGGYTDGTTFGTLQTSITNASLQFSNTELYFLNKKVIVNQTTSSDSVAIGTRSGVAGQSTQSVAIGFAAGELRQQDKSIALGANAAQNDQSNHAIAIGANAGQNAQGSYTIAIGSYAGQGFQPDHSIILNASASTLNTSNAGLFVSPIRTLPSLNTLPLTYNTVSKEIVTSDVLNLSSVYIDSLPLTESGGILYFNGSPVGGGGGVTTTSLTSTTQGLGTLGYLSSALTSADITSTVQGLGTSGYVSTTTALTNVVQAVLTTHQTIPSGSDTIIQFSDDIDPNNWWDSSSYRFQPTINGYYLVNVQAWWQNGVLNGTNQTNIQIRKNGTSLAIAQSPITSSIGNSQTLSKLFQMNGTSDYLDVTAFTGNTTSQVLNGGVNGTYFYATLQ